MMPAQPGPQSAPPGSPPPGLVERLNVPEAWEITRGAEAVLVGVVDTGFDFFHPALKGRLIPGYYHAGGYHTEFYENIAHGTATAGLIVAAGGADAGPGGLAPHCRVLTASLGMIEHTLLLQQRYLQANPKAGAADVQAELAKHHGTLKKAGQEWVRYMASGTAAGIRYLVSHGARVINVSAALTRTPGQSEEVWQDLKAAFAYAAEQGVVMVLGAGNSARQSDDYPGDPADVIVVGATRADGSRWEEEGTWPGAAVKQGSNYGARLTVMAPVEGLRVCVPHDPRMYATRDGPMGPTQVEYQGSYQFLPMGATSSAAPIVAALVALVRTARPDLGVRAVVEVVKQGCDTLGGSYSMYTGYGMANFGKTIKCALNWLD